MAKQKFVKKFVKNEKQDKAEPAVENLTRCELIRALSWYRTFDAPEKKRKQWVNEWLKNPKIKKIHERHFQITLSSICRMASRGYVLSDTDQEFIDGHVEKLLSIVQEKEAEKAEKPAGPTIQERIYAQVVPVLAEIDFYVDEAFSKRFNNKLGSQISDFGRPHIQHLVNHLDSYLNDFVQNKKDDYGFLKTTHMNKVIKYIQALKDECTNLLEAKKKVQKIRTVKKKSPIQIAKNAKISEDTIITPHKIVGTSYAFIYQEKYNRLNLIVAEDMDGLSVKGTSIINSDESKNKSFIVKDFSAFKDIPKSINKMKKWLVDTPKLKLAKGKPSTRLSVKVSIITVL
jgi:hypothetical protein